MFESLFPMAIKRKNAQAPSLQNTGKNTLEILPLNMSCFTTQPQN